MGFRIAGALLTMLALHASAGVLSISIQDEMGNPTAARVYLVGPAGGPLFPKDTIVYNKVRPDGVSERHFVPRHGAFTTEVPAGKYVVTVEKGKEYVPQRAAIAVPVFGAAKRTIRLRRWVKMADRGWFSGDMHVHRSLSDLGVLMEAEDLTASIPITRWRAGKTVSQDTDLDRFLAAADENGVFHEGARFFPVLNEELEPRASALLASGLGRTSIGLEYPLAAFGQAVTKSGGLSDSEKATSLELPALAAVGACATVGLANNHLWRSGSYTGEWGAWPDAMLDKYEQNCNGYVQSGFEMYSALLNAGLSLKLSAGSASGVHPVPIGWSRVYVRPTGPLTPERWFDSLRAGRTFVTTGPMLLLRVNGHEPGDEIRSERFPASLDIAVDMLSPHPIAKCEVVVNGAAHTVELKADASDTNSYRGRIGLIVHSSSWITARWKAARESSCDVAHTSPVYVWKGEEPIPVRQEEVRRLVAAVDRLIEHVKASDRPEDIITGGDELRQRTLDYLGQAREVYRRKLLSSPDTVR
jgi:hypothetical protein